jgi:hypothetical protein
LLFFAVELSICWRETPIGALALAGQRQKNVIDAGARQLPGSINPIVSLVVNTKYSSVSEFLTLSAKVSHRAIVSLLQLEVEKVNLLFPHVN